MHPSLTPSSYCMQQGDVGDGYCDPIFNTWECEWDGGDCCVNTCESSLYPCGELHSFHCKDPRFKANPTPRPTLQPSPKPNEYDQQRNEHRENAATVIMLGAAMVILLVATPLVFLVAYLCRYKHEGKFNAKLVPAQIDRVEEAATVIEAGRVETELGSRRPVEEHNPITDLSAPRLPQSPLCGDEFRGRARFA